MNQPENVKQIVQKGYQKMATAGCGCSCKKRNISASIGYSPEDINAFSDANLGLGCGNPTAMSRIKVGDTVLDLGCGAGFDAFIAARKVGPSGKVIGVDMTREMLDKAVANAAKLGYENTQFILGDIEALPVEKDTIDIVISNCVINLAPDKDKVFAEAHRVLKPGGKLYVSDIVLLEDLTAQQRSDETLIVGCVAGALLKDDYIGKIKRAGFDVAILVENTAISKEQYQGIPLESLTIEATKK